MEDKTQQIEELQLILRAFLEKYPKNARSISRYVQF